MTWEAKLAHSDPVNIYLASDQWSPTVVGLAGGGWVVTWKSYGQDGFLSGIYQQAYGSTGSKIAPETRVNTYVEGGQNAQVVTPLSNGGWVVAWQSYGQDGSGAGVYQQAFDASGAKRGGETLVHSYTFGDQSNHQITALASGGWVVTWVSAPEFSATPTRPPGIYQQVFDANGAKVGTETKVNFYQSGDDGYKEAVTALPDGGWLVSWSSFSGDYLVHQRVYNSNGTPRTFETDVIGSGSASPIEHQVVVLESGGWVVTLQTDGPEDPYTDIKQSVYNANGTLRFTMTVSSREGSYQSDAVTTALKGGGWVVTWVSQGQDGDASGIYQRVYQLNGPPGAEVRVNGTTSGSQHSPVTVPLHDGGWVVAWISERADGTNDVYQRVYDTNGMPLVAEQRVSLQSDRYATGPFDDPSLDVAALSGGGWVVTWDSTFAGSTEANVWQAKFDVAQGDAANNVLSGSPFDDYMFGLAGSDVLDGGTGVDRMDGGTGNDVFWIRNPGDVAVELTGQGIDSVNSLISFSLAGQELENLALLGGAAINGTGNALNNALSGNSAGNVLSGLGGNDRLDGGAGADRMLGGIGNDTYYVDNVADQVVEAVGGGTDTVTASVSYTLGSGVEAELLRTTANGGTSAINLAGNTLKQTIMGNAGANVLHDGGGGGADTLRGLGGNDTYRVFNAGDNIVETATQGNYDVVMAAVDYVLTTGAYVERLATNGTDGTSPIDLTGNSLAQEVIGNAAANILKGMGGDDHIRGQTGNDTLTGGSGRDYFGFNSALNASTNVDRITDFNVADDTIELYKATLTALTTTGTLASSAFRANTTGLAGDASDRIIYETDTGELYYDANGNAAGGGILFAKLGVGLGVTNADFVVI